MAKLLPRIASIGRNGTYFRLYKASTRFINVASVFSVHRCYCNDSRDENNASEPIPTSKSTSSGDTMKASIRSKFSAFSDEENEIVLDMQEEMMPGSTEIDASEEGIYLYREKKSTKKSREIFDLNLNRGKDGVFDLIDLVQSLKLEKVIDVAVIKIPPEKRYCDFLLIGTVRNSRQMTGTLEFLRKLYKLKKSPEDPFLPSVHDRQYDHRKSPWQVIDLGNIVLHLFQPDVRKVYDLETLWTVGPEFDEQTIRPAYDPIVDMMQKHMQFIEKLSPGGAANVTRRA